MTKKKKLFTFQMAQELKIQLDADRKRKGVSMDTLVLQILYDWAENQKQGIDDHLSERN